MQAPHRPQRRAVDHRRHVGRLRATLRQLMRERCGVEPEESTGGGTSDARFIIEISPEVLELGPVNASIHKLNEHIEVTALDQLADIYLDTLRALLP